MRKAGTRRAWAQRGRGPSRTALAALLCLLVSACTVFDFGAYATERLAEKPQSRILMIGDSILAWNQEAGAAAGDALAAALQEEVVNLAIPGARISARRPWAAWEGGDIRAQYRPRAWEWVVIDGGANDLGAECRCRRCAGTLDELIVADGTAGQIPDLVRRIRADGARVVVLGYYPPPATGGRFTMCAAALEDLSARIARFAAGEEGVYYASMATVVRADDAGAYDADGIHPSPAGSAAIGALIAATIRAAGR